MNCEQSEAAKGSSPNRLKRYLKYLAIRVAIYLLTYFILAVVTIGPCFWSWHESYFVNGPKWIAKFYAPLLWICDRCEPLSWLVNKYIDWWIL